MDLIIIRLEGTSLMRKIFVVPKAGIEPARPVRSEGF